MLTNALEAQVNEISAHYHQQKINTLRSIGKIFHNCHGCITHYALRKAQNNLVSVASLDKNATCNNCHFKRTGIPCKHRLRQLIDASKNVEPEEFHPQWQIKVSFSFFCFLLAGGAGSCHPNLVRMVGFFGSCRELSLHFGVEQFMVWKSLGVGWLFLLPKTFFGSRQQLAN
jgi:hypothetical protein